MKKENLERIYIENKVLDNMFIDKYKNVKNLNDCNKIELIAELIELANSSRVFKYRKANIPMDYEDALYEYVDWLTMLFYFFDTNNKKIELEKTNSDIDTVSLILKLIDIYNAFINKNIDNLNEALSRYILLWDKIWFKEEDIIRAALDKIEKTKKYLNQN